MESQSNFGSTNIFLQELAKKLKLKNFRGVFMRDNLPSCPLNTGLNTGESGIMNFDKEAENGSHWVAWYVKGDVKGGAKATNYYYFDSYGTAVPDELRKYLGRPKIHHSDFMIQGINSDICGELCIAFIYAMDNTNKTYEEIVRGFLPEPIRQ